jgi:hypothetical protein
VCRTSSGITGGGPVSAASAFDPDGIVAGHQRAIAQPIRPAASTTTGKGTAKSARARKDSTARASSALLRSAREPTRITAWATIARTAGARPANSAVTATVEPNAT